MRIGQVLTVAALVVLGCFSARVVTAAGFKVVAHPAVPVDSLSRSDVSRVFLKKQIRWSSGASAVPVDQAADSSVRGAFSKAIHQKPTAAIVAYWQKQVFSGRDVPPATRGSDSEVLAFVKATPGAIGYVSPGASTAGVKVIEIR
jgi:ABC-type phosphate transport system substrate-binding protein